MRKASLLSVICLLGCLSQPSNSNEPITYDAPSGQYVELYGGPVTTDLFVACDFSVEHTYTGTEWHASVGIVFSTSEEVSDSKQLVKLEAIKPANDKGWRYFFTIVESGDRDTQIVAFPGQSDSMHRLSMARDSDGNFIFLVGDELDYTSNANVSRLAIRSWSVIASGAKGSVYCSNDPAAMPDR